MVWMLLRLGEPGRADGSGMGETAARERGTRPRRAGPALAARPFQLLSFAEFPFVVMM
jgi:hypothetical protein